MMRLLTPFEELLEKSKKIHLSKRADYTTNPDANPHENFERANELISWFPPEYKSYAAHIGTKLTRLGSLLSSNREPNNESLEDTYLDLVTYCGLMYDFYKRKHMPKTQTGSFVTGNQGQPITFGGDLVIKDIPREVWMGTAQEREYAASRLQVPKNVETPCHHDYINLNRHCAYCGDTISWLVLDGNYRLDRQRDCYIKR